MEYRQDSIAAVLRCVVIVALGDRILSVEEDMLLSFSFEIEKRRLEKMFEQELDIEDEILDAVKKDVKDCLELISQTDRVKLEKYIALSASKVVSTKLRERTFRAAKRVASADGLHMTEDYVLQRFAEAWEIIS